MAPDGENMTGQGWMTEYRIAWYHQQGSPTITHQGMPYYTITIGTPLQSEKSQIYSMGCTHRAEVLCGPIRMLLACNFNHDDEVLFNAYPLWARFGSEDIRWDLVHLARDHTPLNLKFHRQRDEKGHRFVDLYMYIWHEGYPMRVLMLAKKITGHRRPPLTDLERIRLGIPQDAWDVRRDAEWDPRNDYMLPYSN
ncbi:MAG: hypothetical protein Q9195_006029 [Heterodermia aff. obscurata]